ncbi:Crp/Fnr family transcriptional regulator [Actinoallomurus sp. NPDC052308]|uniref:Crp/Fnr family transcriptional regulator n=1 Tax=Actinoallomurus sp. NPDC052308 TaxID=3155530 RepID=UPI003420AE29
MAHELWPKASYLAALTKPTRDELLQLGRARTYGPGENLFLQGDPGGVVFILLTGRVNVIANVENGTESLLAIRHPGDVLGEMAVFGEMPRTATVTARLRSTALLISGDQFKRFVATHPDAGFALTATTSGRLRQANIYRADAAGYEVEQRIARTLLYQAQRSARKAGEHWSVDLMQAELAMLIGAKEGTVQKAFRNMKDLVSSRRGRVLIHNIEKLAELAEIEPPNQLLGEG